MASLESQEERMCASTIPYRASVGLRGFKSSVYCWPVSPVNIAPLDRVLMAHIREKLELVKEIIRYRRAFANWLVLIRHLRANAPFPLIARLRTGGELLVESRAHLYIYSYTKGGGPLPLWLSGEFTLTSDGELKFEFNWRHSVTPVRVSGYLSNGDPSILLKDEYGWLDVQGRTVIDVGANIGDSPIYFCLRGASKVIALEPIPMSFEMAAKNIATNGFGRVVHLRREAIGGDSGEIRIPLDAVAETGSQARDFQSGLGTRVVNLEDLVMENSVSDGILKMDCEGAEYDSIIRSQDNILRSFYQMHIEYHYGPRSLVMRLRSAGFRVTADKPRRFGHPQPGMPPMYVGNIRATRQGLA